MWMDVFLIRPAWDTADRKEDKRRVGEADIEPEVAEYGLRRKEVNEHFAAWGQAEHPTC